MVRLTGQQLLEFLRDNPSMSRDEAIKATGYVKVKKDRPGLLRSEFYQALAQAQGIPLGPPVGRKRQPTGRLKVTSKGTLPVGAPYTRMLCLEIGDYDHAVYEDGRLILTAWDENDVTHDTVEKIFEEIEPTALMSA